MTKPMAMTEAATTIPANVQRRSTPLSNTCLIGIVKGDSEMGKFLGGRGRGAALPTVCGLAVARTGYKDLVETVDLESAADRASLFAALYPLMERLRRVLSRDPSRDGLDPGHEGVGDCNCEVGNLRGGSDVDEVIVLDDQALRNDREGIGPLEDPIHQDGCAK